MANQNKDRKRNVYQIGIILCIVLMLVYGYAAYNAFRIFHHSKGYINIGIMCGWFVLALYWLKQLGKLPKHNKE